MLVLIYFAVADGFFSPFLNFIERFYKVYYGDSE